MRRLLATAAVLLAFTLAGELPASAGYDYEEKLDRFEGRRTASFKAKTGKECKLVESTKGSLAGCTFIHSTENNVTYPSIMLYKTSKGWDLLSYKNSTGDEIPVILTYLNGEVKRLRLPAELSTSTLSGANVIEFVLLRLRPIKDDLPVIEKIETRYGSAEFMWVVDNELVKKSLEFVGN